MVSAPAPPSSVLLPPLPVMAVGAAVAGAVDVAAAGQGQVLDVGAERVADRRLHRVGALVERLGHHVAGIVDDVGVVAERRRSCVSAPAPPSSVSLPPSPISVLAPALPVMVSLPPPP